MIIKFKWCPRKELIPMNFYEKGMEIYKAELTTTLSKMEAFCHQKRTERLGCSLQTVSWSNGKRDNRAYKAMNAARSLYHARYARLRTIPNALLTLFITFLIYN